MIARAFTIASIAFLWGVSTGWAQDSPLPRAHHLMISGGLRWDGGYPIGGNTAAIRRNTTGTTSPGPFTLFTADASIGRATGFDARVAYALTRTFAVELRGGYAKPQLIVRVTGDTEGETATLGDEHLSQYTVGGSAVWQLSQVKLGRRTAPYLIGGASYLRQLYEDRVQVETGRLYHAGGGVNYWAHGGDRSHRGFGLRGEVRMELRSGGVDIERQTRVFPAVSLMGFFSL